MDALAFPLSAILAGIFITVTLLCRGKASRSKFLKFLSGRVFSTSVLILATILTAVEGTWKLGLFHNPGFLFLVLLMMFTLGLSFSITHFGFLLILFGGFFGAPDFTDGRMAVSYEVPSSYAVSPDGLTIPLDFNVKLKDFRIEYHEDGTSPKQYTSVLEIDGAEKTTSVNKPCHHNGYFIYQSDYDRTDGAFSVLYLVRDPWLIFVIIGMVVLAAGAVLDLRRTWHSKAVLPIVVALAVVFGLISMARINLGTLMPALRSLWFVPHLIIYMMAYSVLALSVICGIISIFGKPSAGDLSAKLLGTASSLLIIGMLCGAAWAKTAWGDYWTWDAKECWAAATWMLTLIGLHLPSRKGRKGVLTFTILAFLAMQITWYGVNYLPSAEYSMHTYNN